MSMGLSHRSKKVSSVYNSFRSKNNAPTQICLNLCSMAIKTSFYKLLLIYNSNYETQIHTIIYIYLHFLLAIGVFDNLESVLKTWKNHKSMFWLYSNFLQSFIVVNKMLHAFHLVQISSHFWHTFRKSLTSNKSSGSNKSLADKWKTDWHVWRNVRIFFKQRNSKENNRHQ